MNTVHVEDVCRSVWHLCNHGNKGDIYNVVDSGDTSKFCSVVQCIPLHLIPVNLIFLLF